MSEYGITSTGFVKKRLDTICDEIHDDLSKEWGINTRKNPKSYLNVLITNFADKIAELWEVAEENYFSKYPSSATGDSLDRAAEYAGVLREQAEHSYYQVECTGDDGTVIPKGTPIEADCNPKIQLVAYDEGKISRESCSKITISEFGVESILKFSESILYVPGDRCVYENVKYECIQSHVGAWNASDFSVVSDTFAISIDNQHHYESATIFHETIDNSEEINHWNEWNLAFEYYKKTSSIYAYKNYVDNVYAALFSYLKESPPYPASYTPEYSESTFGEIFEDFLEEFSAYYTAHQAAYADETNVELKKLKIMNDYLFFSDMPWTIAFCLENSYQKPVTVKTQDVGTLYYQIANDNTLDCIVSYSENDNCISLDFNNVSRNVSLNSRLKSTQVSSINTFGTTDYGDIVIPPSINYYTGEASKPTCKLKKVIDGFNSVKLLDGYIAGRERETDAEFRDQYGKKIFIRSRTMLESITAAILQNVPQVKACKAYQNDTHVYQSHRPPHSVEVIVEFGNNQSSQGEIYQEIAEQIMATKAAGIQTCNCQGLSYSSNSDLFGPISGLEDFAPYAVTTYVKDDYDNDVAIRFSLPIPCMIDVTVTAIESSSEEKPSNAEELVKEVIRNSINSLEIGEDLIADKFIYKLYNRIPGFSKFEVKFAFHWKKYTTTYTPNPLTQEYEADVSVEDIEETDTTSFIGVPENMVCRFSESGFTFYSQAFNGGTS